MVPPAELMETVRQKLKINKKQFLRCWEILIFLSLDSQDHKSMDNFRACIYDRIKGEILGSASGTNGKRLLQMPSSSNEESFAVYWTQESGDADNQTVEQQPEDLKTQEQQLNELVDNQMEEIVGVAKNVNSRGKDKLVELVAQWIWVIPTWDDVKMLLKLTWWDVFYGLLLGRKGNVGYYTVIVVLEPIQT